MDDTSDISFSELNVPTADIGGDPVLKVLLGHGSQTVKTILTTVARNFAAHRARFEFLAKSKEADPHLELLTQKV